MDSYLSSSVTQTMDSQQADQHEHTIQNKPARESTSTVTHTTQSDTTQDNPSQIPDANKAGESMTLSANTTMENYAPSNIADNVNNPILQLPTPYQELETAHTLAEMTTQLDTPMELNMLFQSQHLHCPHWSSTHHLSWSTEY